MIKLKHTVPFIILFALFGLLWRELFYSKPNELPSALIGEPLPYFALPTLFIPETTFSQKNLGGQVSLLNIWATWCYACGIEHDMLVKISKQYRVPIYGIDYKDDPEEAKKWLKKRGNPYMLIGNDKQGDAAIDLGVYGTPETFIISPQGKIIYRHIGAFESAMF